MKPVRPTREELFKYIREVPDFPKPGISFKDITPLLADPVAFEVAVDHMADAFRGQRVTRVAGIESRGFIFGARVAALLGVGFVPVRKPGKLPWRRARIEYQLEYGSDALEMHEDAVTAEDHVLIVDDVLATGGTAQATRALLEQRGAVVAGFAFLMELRFLSGRARLGTVAVHSVLAY